MGTRAVVAVEYETGQIEAIYTHWDGYPNHHAPILSQHYTEPGKLEALMGLGSLSSLDIKIGEKHPFDTYGIPQEEKDLWQDWCTAYVRDRGEDWETCKPEVYPNLERFTNDLMGGGKWGWCEWAYLFSGGVWHILKIGDLRWLSIREGYLSSLDSWMEDYQPKVIESLNELEASDIDVDAFTLPVRRAA